MFPPYVAVRENRVVAYAAAPISWQLNHAVAESTEDMQSLLSGAARLSGKHTLALTNRGQAVAEDVLDLAREIRSGVRTKFGVTLVPEPVLVGCEL